MKKNAEKPIIDKIIEEYERLKLAAEILERIYVQIGPYNTVLDQQTHSDLNNFFHFDDSE